MTAAPKPDPMEILMDAYLAELTEMSDDEVLDGKDPDSVRAAGLQLLESARGEAGKRRMAVARQKLEARSTVQNSQPKGAGVSPAEARAALRRAAAANDGRYTLAARQLDEMSDEDVIRAYVQLRKLESENSSGSSGDAQ